MRNLSLFLAAATALAACAPVETDPPSTPAGDGPDQCMADRYRSYIGRNRSELPPTPAGESWRVTCTTCPVTMDYNPKRLNIFYDQATGVIREVKCG